MQQLELKQNNEGSKLGGDREGEAFDTIDDLSQKAEELSPGFKKLMHAKHPLDIRRGVRKAVKRNMRNDSDSKQLKAAGRTYFLDFETTREGERYLRITESRRGVGISGSETP